MNRCGSRHKTPSGKGRRNAASTSWWLACGSSTSETDRQSTRSIWRKRQCASQRSTRTWCLIRRDLSLNFFCRKTRLFRRILMEYIIKTVLLEFVNILKIRIGNYEKSRHDFQPNQCQHWGGDGPIGKVIMKCQHKGYTDQLPKIE